MFCIEGLPAYRAIRTKSRDGRNQSKLFRKCFYARGSIARLRDGCCNYFNPGIKREGEPEPAHKIGDFFYPRDWAMDSIIFEPYIPKERDFYTTDYFTNYTLQYSDEYKDLEKPFFMYMAFTAPHDPLMA
jgi:hypothetical protein